MIFASLLQGKTIADAHVDTELTYIMLTDGTQITIRGTVVVQPKEPNDSPRND